MSSAASSVLFREFRQLTDPKKRIPSFHIELENNNIFLWNIGLMVLNEDSIYHGGYFKAQMKFPSDFPYSPPTFRFTPPIYHPNVYKDGKLCISILHSAGDATSDELDSETWSPVQTVETVLISIISLLEDPNLSSPANVDASLTLRNKREEFEKIVRKEVERSREDIPEDFEMPQNANSAYSSKASRDDQAEIIDESFWYDSDQSFEEDSLMDDFEEEEDEDDAEETEEAEEDEENK